MLLPAVFDLLVLGLGSTGLAVARWGVAHTERVRSVTVYGGAGATSSAETEELAAQGAKVVLGTEEVEGHYDVCVVSPGISEFSDFCASGKAHAADIMGEPEFTFRLSPERWVAITGTNGKTTTTALTNHLLNAAGLSSVAVGNIGLAPVAVLDERAKDTWFAAELSSYQLATTTYLHPRVAVLLNITPDHLAWHRSLEAYAAAKCKIFANLGSGDLAVVCVEDEGAARAVPAARATGAAVCELAHADTGAACAAFVSADGMLIVRQNGTDIPLIVVEDLKIQGAHNELNALAAAAAALWVGADADDVRRALTTFEPLEHRIEPVAVIDGVRYVNDSKATNTDAVEKALTAFPKERVVLLLGGSDKGTPLASFAQTVASSTVKAVVCFGAARQRLLDAFTELGSTNNLELAEAENLADAVNVGRTLAERGDVVLLSPACASFDEFSSFEERGRRFKELVAELAHEGDVTAAAQPDTTHR